eukprot:8509637-Pyramimonas_sp.AAC.2
MTNACTVLLVTLCTCVSPPPGLVATTNKLHLRSKVFTAVACSYPKTIGNNTPMYGNRRLLLLDGLHLEVLLERDGAVEHGRGGGAVVVHAEVTHPLRLCKQTPATYSRIRQPRGDDYVTPIAP